LRRKLDPVGTLVTVPSKDRVHIQFWAPPAFEEALERCAHSRCVSKTALLIEVMQRFLRRAGYWTAAPVRRKSVRPPSR